MRTRALEADLPKEIPSLGEFLGMEAMEPALEKRLFGGYNVRALPFIWAEFWVFQKGLVLGRAMRHNLAPVATMLAERGDHPKLQDFMIETAATTFRDYEASRGKEPESLLKLFEWERFKGDINLSEVNVLKLLTKKKARLGEMRPYLLADLISGVGIGAAYPGLVESLWEQLYGAVEEDQWQNARSLGLDLPGQQSELRIDETETMVMEEARQYAVQYFPELVDDFTPGDAPTPA